MKFLHFSFSSKGGLTEVSACLLQHARTSRAHLEHRIIFKSIEVKEQPETGRHTLRASYSSLQHEKGNIATSSSGQVETGQVQHAPMIVDAMLVTVFSLQ
jgi:hypothetical protein